MYKTSKVLLAALMLVAFGRAVAHGEASHSAAAQLQEAAEQQAWGIAGAPGDVLRVIEVRMDDRMRFVPGHIEVREGETVRLRIHNDGKTLHELVLGTPQSLAEHAELMKQFPGMEHGDPWMAHVAPGGEGSIVWTFNRAGSFEFACLIAGHYQAGMRGTVTVSPKAPQN